MQNLLYYLFVNGPFTSGIFRKSANHKAVMELREKLDNDDELTLDDINTVVIASVVKVQHSSLDITFL